MIFSEGYFFIFPSPFYLFYPISLNKVRTVIGEQVKYTDKK